MKKCLVIGGGIAGLSTAVYLSDSGYQVEVIESSPKTGGRTYSFHDTKSGSVIDNGQHILMGCYKDTIDLINKIKAEDHFIFQKQLSVTFVKENCEFVFLTAPNSFYPLNLLSALFNYNALNKKEKLRLLLFFIKMNFYPESELLNFTVIDWLKKEKQSDNSIKAFWEILAVGALNASIEKANAAVFKTILNKIFFNGNKAATIIIPKTGLSEAFISNAENFICKKNGSISTSEKVIKINSQEEEVLSVVTDKRIITEFDYVVAAVPHYSLKKILPEIFITADDLDYSSILNIHLWLEEFKFRGDFFGLIGSPVHWIFNKDDHLNLVISDADYLIKRNSEEIMAMVKSELKKYLDIDVPTNSHYKIIKEKLATFLPSKKNMKLRMFPKTKYKNLFLAGDWTNTGLPSTIESAVKSGRIAAELVSGN
ncbi:MAG: hydroxysqualene dehydroxylase HpnE [Ignavibacteriaceae bacterium]